MGYRVILAEKPSVARSIAQVVGANSQCNGYFEGNNFRVTWAYGHLVTLCDTDEYDSKYKTWKISDLPIFPNEFKYKVIDKCQEQYSIVKSLFQKADEIICATDAGREGEAIFRNIYYHTGVKTPFKRLWISALVDKEIKRGMSDLKDGSDYDNLFYSAQNRAFADWLIGINATRAFTLSNRGAKKGNKPLSIGRVQTPTFSFICKRYFEHINFVPTSTFIPTCTLTFGKSKPFVVTYPTQFKSADDAVKVLNDVGETMTVVDKESKLVTEKAPLPFNLSALQQAANKKYNFSAQRTLDVLQNLYESKFVSYPRTESAYYNEVLLEQFQDNLSKIGDYFDDKNIGNALELLKDGIKNKSAFDDSKVSDHHALMPMFDTMNSAKTMLKGDDKKIYNLVTLQMLMSILPPCKKNQTTYKFEYKSDCTPMKASGSVIKESGWRTIFGDSDEEEEDEEKQTLPDMKKGDVCDVKSKDVKERVTKRPALLTEATLLKQMETAGKLVDDAELKKCMVSGIGTAATRASIIELIKARGLVEIRDHKYFVPTALGQDIYLAVKDLKVASPELTGEWEYKLNKIADGAYDKDDFLKGIKEYASTLVTECLGCHLGDNFTPILGGDEKCPVCGSPIYENGKIVYCENHENPKDKCPLIIWKNIAGHLLTKEEVHQLLCDGKTDVIDGFESKRGSKFAAKLVLDPKNPSVSFEFENNFSNCETNLVCPYCGGKIIEKEKMYVCEKNDYKDKKSCKFIIWKSIVGYSVTVDDVKEILETHQLANKSFVSKAKKPFNATLIFNDDYTKYEFKFEDKL